MAQILDGHCDFDNVFPEEIARHNMSMYGTGDYVLQIGECLGYELVSNNEIQIKDGMFITQGRRGYVKSGTTDKCIIENVAQSLKRHDIVVIEYSKDESTMLESHTTKIIKGVAAEEADDPEIVTGDINSGATLHQMPLYRIKINGLNVESVEQLFKIGSVAAETVDPMLATEGGFAADALATKKQFDEQNKKLLLTYNSSTDCFGMIDPYTGVWKDVVRAYFREKALIPIMTSNNDISGITVSASTKIREPYMAFDGIDDTSWVTNYQSSGWLLVKFDNPKIATKFKVYAIGGKNGTGNFVIQGSKNGSDFVDLTNHFGYTGTEVIIDATVKEQFNYYRVYITGATTDTVQGNTPGVRNWQIYGQEVV